MKGNLRKVLPGASPSARRRVRIGRASVQAAMLELLPTPAGARAVAPRFIGSDGRILCASLREPIGVQGASSGLNLARRRLVLLQ